MVKSRARIAVVCILALAASLLTGCAKDTSLDQEDSYTSVFLAYLAGVGEGEYDALYGLLTERSRERITQEDFVTRHHNIYSGIEMSNYRAEITSVEEIAIPEGETAQKGRQIRYEARMDTSAGEISFATAAIVYGYQEEEGAVFRLAWDSHLIFPNLGDEDKVRVEGEKGERGEIFDRNGVLLAGSGTVKSVGFVPGKMGDHPKEGISLAAEILQMSVETIEKKLAATWVRDDHFVPLKSLSEADVERKEALLQIPGIRIADARDRVYPLGPAAAHLTGYVQNISKEELEGRAGRGYTANSKLGKIGLESLLEDRIRGIDGSRIIIVDANGGFKEELASRPAVHGEDVHLTIDARLQGMLYEQLKDDKSATVVMNPVSGEVLALMSTPAYDPNEFVLGLAGALWQQWQEDERKPLYNRFKASLVPGSSFKPIIAALGLTGGDFTAEENFGYTGRSWQKDSSWGKYTVTTLVDYGDQVTLKNALIHSDNIYFARAALKIGGASLSSGLRGLGFFQQAPFAFGLTESSFGREGVFETDIELADSGYGQGRVLVNPVHMASMYTAFANGGDMIAPYLEKGVSSQGQVWIKNAFSQSAASTVLQDLIAVVESPKGTAHEAWIEGMTIAGKTGTAEIKDSKDDQTGTELGWYVAFDAGEGLENPCLFVCMVEDVKDRRGSHYVLPIGKSVFERAWEIPGQ